MLYSSGNFRLADEGVETLLNLIFVIKGEEENIFGVNSILYLSIGVALIDDY